MIRTYLVAVLAAAAAFLAAGPALALSGDQAGKDLKASYNAENTASQIVHVNSSCTVLSDSEFVCVARVRIGVTGYEFCESFRFIDHHGDVVIEDESPATGC